MPPSGSPLLRTLGKAPSRTFASVPITIHAYSGAEARIRNPSSFRYDWNMPDRHALTATPGASPAGWSQPNGVGTSESDSGMTVPLMYGAAGLPTTNLLSVGARLLS